MTYLYNAYSDKGRIKKINQDAVFLMEAETDNGNVLFAAISDGMGGLAKGEEASARMTRALSAWFEKTLPNLLYSPAGVTEMTFKRSMQDVIRKTCLEIEDYASGFGGQCGTTLSGILIMGDEWFAVNVGDSRIYLHDGIGIFQITKDQTYVQREIDAGRMTPKEAETHKMRSILLQCIGASEVVIPDWHHGYWKKGNSILLCSDGFRHKIRSDEMVDMLSASCFQTDEDIHSTLYELTMSALDRGERDNVSSILICRK